MDFLVAMAEVSIWVVGIVLLIAQLVAHEIGYGIGNRIKSRGTDQPENVGVVVGGMLGLLAFVLALTLSYSNARFNERRQDTLAEANAVGTAWLRANAIGSPEAVEVARLLQDYLNTRERFIQAGRNESAIAEANDETTKLQQSIWRHVTSLVRERPDPISASLMAAVNETFDASTSERFAVGTHLPSQIFWLLIGVMLLTMGSLGYQFGLKGKPVRVLVFLLTVVWTSVIVNILDLASARVGNFRTDLRAYEWTRQGFSVGGAPAAPTN